MNKAESERISGMLEDNGCQPVGAIEDADVIVLNGCVVRQNAENKVRNKISALKKIKRDYPDKTLAVTGCFVDPDTEELHRLFPYVDYFFKPGELPPWLDMPARLPLPRHPDYVTYVPIMQGCDNFCSYCIVPYRRGRERSRPPEEIIAEVNELVRRGTKEVILLGQNVNSYGKDLPGNPRLAELLASLNGIEGLLRIRFLTNHPKDMGLDLIDAIASLEKVCEQVNLPVQAGNNDVLRAMRRGYSREQYRSLVGTMRERVPGLALSTDVIVGFPGETDAMFHDTYNLLKELKFDTVHVAAYSPREGTLAARELADDVSPAVKKERLEGIERLQEGIAREINSQLPGKRLEVLVEGKSRGKWYGRTRTDRPVFFMSNAFPAGKLVEVEITFASPWSLQGKLIVNEEEPDA